MKNVFLFLLLALSVLTCKKEAKKPAPPTPDPEKEEVVIPEAPKFRNIQNDKVDTSSLTLIPNDIQLQNGKSFTLNLPEGYAITPAAEGLKRVRFFAKAPDNRLFVTGMHNLTDNKKGKIFILDSFNLETKQFDKISEWKTALRNPNSVQFYQDTTGQDWIYYAVTDGVIRHKYEAGELMPTGVGEEITTFPGQGLSYKYGGWHLTRTLAFFEDKLYISVGSSCNLCEEVESERATILQMNPDGTDKKVYANGIRNAVDLSWVEGQLYATNMASDHLGNDMPNDYFYQVNEGQDYGWPYCYEHNGQLYDEDPKDQSDNRVAGKIVKDTFANKTINCQTIPKAYALFEAHAAPLGFEYFDHETKSNATRNYFLVAHHGSTLAKVGTGHRIIRMKSTAQQSTLIDGFLKGKTRVGRPCDIIQNDDKSFFFTDDYAGVVYYVEEE